MIMRTVVQILAVWLAGLGLALAQGNSIESVNVTEQGGKVILRIVTKEGLSAVPPNFTVSNPARIAFDFPNTANALGRSSQDFSQGELRSMNVVQGANRTRVVLNLRRPVPHEAAIEGKALVVTLSVPAVSAAAPAGQTAHFADGKADAKHAIRDVDFRRGSSG